MDIGQHLFKVSFGRPAYRCGITGMSCPTSRARSSEVDEAVVRENRSTSLNYPGATSCTSTSPSTRVYLPSSTQLTSSLLHFTLLLGALTPGAAKHILPIRLLGALRLSSFDTSLETPLRVHLVARLGSHLTLDTSFYTFSGPNTISSTSHYNQHHLSYIQPFSLEPFLQL